MQVPFLLQVFGGGAWCVCVAVIPLAQSPSYFLLPNLCGDCKSC
jgi:hypothetical protein